MKLNDLDKLIPQYAANKAELDDYKKICDKENAQIKAIMKDFVVTNYEASGYKATYSVSNRETMNEDILISLFTSVPGFVSVSENYGIVKNKPYIDFDALEKAIYDDKLTQDQLMELNKAKEVKEVVTLRVSKVKKSKNDE